MNISHLSRPFFGSPLPPALLCTALGMAGCGNVDDAQEAGEKNSQYTISGNLSELLEELRPEGS